MELTALLERMKMEHLLAQLDGVCEQAAKGDVDDKGFLTRPWMPNGAVAISAAWRAGSSWPGCLGSRRRRNLTSTSSPRSTARPSGSWPGSAVERTENVVLLGLPGVGKTHPGRRPRGQG